MLMDERNLHLKNHTLSYRNSYDKLNSTNRHSFNTAQIQIYNYTIQ